MIGERPPATDFWCGWWYATGASNVSTGDVTLGMTELNPTGTTPGMSFWEDCDPGPSRYQPGNNQQCDTLHFWSYHPGSVNFALADGSVHFIPYSIEPSVTVALATAAGGELVILEF